MNTVMSLGALATPASDFSQAGATTQKADKSAKDFEALLIGQMLRSVREEGSGWLGTDGDDADATAMGLGEEELAKAMSAAGGFGLAKVVASGLAERPSNSEPEAP